LWVGTVGVERRGDPVERLTAEDRVLLWPDEIWPQEIGALAVLDGGPLLEPGGRFAIERARAAIGARSGTGRKSAVAVFQSSAPKTSGRSTYPMTSSTAAKRSARRGRAPRFR